MEAAALAPAADRTMTLSRHFRASPQAVFAAWTDPEVLPRWFGPEGLTCRTHRIDLREGGEWVFDFVGYNVTFPNRHRWIEIAPHSRLRFLMDAGEGTGEPMEVTVTFAPEDGGTRLTQSVVFPTVERWTEAKGYDAEAKGMETLGKLAAWLGE